MCKSILSDDKNKMTIDFYNQQASYFSKWFLNTDTSPLCNQFLTLLPEKAHILDMGCGPGGDTKYFLDRGYQVTALDAAEEFVKIARQHTGHPILHMTFQEMTFQRKFDGIWAMASLLHLSPNQLMEVFEKNIIPALKPQGILYLCFQYGEGERFSNNRYFADYTEKSLRVFLEKFDILNVLNIWENKKRLWVHGFIQKM